MKKPIHYPHSGARLWNDRTGLPYRTGGPALERTDGSKEWWLHGHFMYSQTGSTFWRAGGEEHALKIDLPGYEDEA